jgi:hypothetical protein
MKNECTFHEYYSQFVTDFTKCTVTGYIGNKAFLTEKYNEDENLNNIPLSKWDNIAHGFCALNERNDGKLYSSLSNGICVLKTAARMIVKGE